MKRNQPKQTHIKNPFTHIRGAAKRGWILLALIGGLALLLAHRVTAQNYQAWPVTHIAAGGNHTLFTRADGTLFVMGDNTHGQLGLGSTVTNMNVPVLLTNHVGTIAAGEYHSLFIMNRALWAMGDNEHGQLGDGTTNNSYFPEQVFTLGHGISFTAVGAGWYHSLFGTASLTSGSLWAMGNNGNGELGDGSYNDHNTPEVIFSVSPGNAVTAVAGGDAHSLFIKPDGSVGGMGNNTFRQLGSNLSTNKPVEVYSGGPSTVVAGLGYSFFIESSVLICIGENNYGQLGMPFGYSEYQDVTTFSIIAGPGGYGPEFPYTTNAVVAVAARNYHSLFILSDGTLWDMGNNGSGQLGVGFAGYFTDVPQEIVASNVVAVAAGDNFSLFIKSDGSLWGMGYNANGQLGTGDYTDRQFPVEIVSPPPQISIIPYGANVFLAWPSNAVGFILQSTTNLASPAWTTVSPGPVIVGDQFVVFTPSSGTQQFYRLVLSE